MRKVLTILLSILTCSSLFAGNWRFSERYTSDISNHVYGADIWWERTNDYENSPAIGMIRLWIRPNGNKVIQAVMGSRHPFLIEAARHGFRANKNDFTGITIEREPYRINELECFLLLVAKPEYGVPQEIIRKIAAELGLRLANL